MHDLEMQDDDIQPITLDLPLRVRAALARAWVMTLAIERGLNDQPRDNIDSRLWTIDLITDDMADIGRDALDTLDADLAITIVNEAADAAMVCGNCLAQAIWPVDGEADE